MTFCWRLDSGMTKQVSVILKSLLLSSLWWSLAYGIPPSVQESVLQESPDTQAEQDDSRSNVNSARALLLSSLEDTIRRYKDKDHRPLPDEEGAYRSPALSPQHKSILKIKEGVSVQTTDQIQYGVPLLQGDPFDEIRQHYRIRQIKEAFPDTRFGSVTPSSPFLELLRQSSVDFGFDRLYGIDVELRKGESIEEFVGFCSQLPATEYAEIDYPVIAHAMPKPYRIFFCF